MNHGQAAREALDIMREVLDLTQASIDAGEPNFNPTGFLNSKLDADPRLGLKLEALVQITKLARTIVHVEALRRQAAETAP